MPMLVTTVPSSVDTPGSFHTFTHVKAGGSLVPLALRVLIVGVKSSAGTATALTPVQILDVNDAITKCGIGSEAALMAAKGFEQGLLNQSSGRGGIPEIWACPITAPAGGAVAAEQTLTVTGPATASGTLILRIAGRYIYVGVNAGDAQNTIAAAIEDEIDALAKELPVSASVASNVVTCVHRTSGTNGNDVAYEVVQTVAGVSVALAASVVGTGTVDITAAVDASFDKDYDAIVISIHSSTAVTDAIAHLADAWTYSQKSWRWVVMGDRASLGTAQGYATSADTERILIPSCEGCPNLPSEIAMAVAVAAWGVEAPNSNYDDVELALYPPPTASAYTGAEVESAIDGGVTPLAPTHNGARLRIVRLVTTKITDGGAPYKLLADLAFIRTIAYRATQYDISYRIQFRQQVIDGPITDPEATLLKRIRDMMVSIDRNMAALGYLRDVETYIPQFLVEEAQAPQGRVLARAPCRVAGPLHQVAFEHLSYL